MNTIQFTSQSSSSFSSSSSYFCACLSFLLSTHSIPYKIITFQPPSNCTRLKVILKSIIARNSNDPIPTTYLTERNQPATILFLLPSLSSNHPLPSPQPTKLQQPSVSSLSDRFFYFFFLFLILFLVLLVV